MPLNNCRCFQTHLRMLLQSLTPPCLAPGGPGSICTYLGVPVRSTRVSGRFACGFRTDLHFADVSATRSRLFFVRPLLLVYNSGYCGLRTDITPVTSYPETKSARHVPITCRNVPTLAGPTYPRFPAAHYILTLTPIPAQPLYPLPK
jgi:hypothetical protein